MWQDRLHHWAVFTETSRGFVPYYLAGIRHDLRQTTVFQAVCILWSFEPCIGFDVVNLYFPGVACFLAPCTDGAVPEEYLFPQVSLAWPAFASVDVVIAEKAFSLHAVLFFFDLILLGVGVVPGPRSIPLGFILGWHDQFYCSGSEGVFLAESLHDCWHVALVFAP